LIHDILNIITMNTGHRDAWF